jgi:uridine kinase
MLYGTFDHPDLIEYSLLDKNIHELIQKGSADIPEYSFKERRRVETHRVEGQYDFIIVE